MDITSIVADTIEIKIFTVVITVVRRPAITDMYTVILTIIVVKICTVFFTFTESVTVTILFILIVFCKMTFTVIRTC